MTYDRMKAKKIKGEHCRFCGDKTVPLVKTQCCNQWICCDTKALSYRGGGYCQFQHEHYSVCFSHFNEGHTGTYMDCTSCKDLWGPEFETKLTDSTNLPTCMESRDSFAAAMARMFNI